MSKFLRLFIIAWFLCQYKTITTEAGITYRYCPMDDFTSLIRSVGGNWSEAQCKDRNYAIVKVNATNKVINQIEAGLGTNAMIFNRTNIESLIDAGTKTFETLDSQVK